MPSFKYRSYQKELLDRDDIPFEDIKRNMQELDLINRKLGGHSITIDGCIKLMTGIKPVSILNVTEIGCGGGDNMRAIMQWAKNKNIRINLTGIDINSECIAYAQQHPANEGMKFIRSDYRDVVFEKKPDICFSSLFCHHFSEDELVFMLIWMQQNSSLGFFINDLHRHPLAWHSIRLLTRLFSKSYLFKNDAPLSVQRGFKKNEWTEAFNSAGISSFSCEWRWAFRWLVTCRPNATETGI
ncbi:MAG: methyltransferase domain-containing protein [Flavisolibacter sp.]